MSPQTDAIHTALPVATHRSWREPVMALLSAALTTLLFACGPGVVGTGTGASAPADVCAANFAPSVSLCTTSGGTLTAAPSPQVFIDAQDAAPATVVASLQGSALALRQRCQGLDYSGQWSRWDDGRTAYDGTLRSAAFPDGTRAIVQAEAAPMGSGWELRLTLQDPYGNTLGGPWFVRRTVQPVVDATCPS